MISYGKQSIDQSDIDEVLNVIESDWLTQGPTVKKFEEALKSYFGANYCCVVSNGTAALHLAGLALGWKEGDIIITTPITFLASANCILYAGAIPDFVDIDPISYTIDTNQLEEKIKSYQDKGKKVKAIIGVDYAGHPCDWKGLRDLAQKYDVQLVNDNCHALGASYFEDKQYAANYADVVIQSYHPLKHITTGEGGAILTNNLIIDKKVRSLRSHGMTKDPDQLENNHGPWYYEIHELGYNYRITDFQCALGISQLKKLDNFVSKRRALSKRYADSLKDFNNITLPHSSNDVEHAFHLYSLKIDFDKNLINKIQFFKNMKNQGILLQVHYIPVHIQPYYKRNYGFNEGDYPNAEKFYEQEISLPIFPTLSNDEQNYVIESIKNNYVK